jgi:tetratricopeptide (TPR) repeat protein|tara:strand:- start:114 stop:1202 length:1089 start_codon:yes stop_codon:yes gene_type:complete
MFTPEQLQISKIIESFKTDPLINTLSIINKSNLNYPNLNYYPIYHNLNGMVNLRLQKYEEAVLNFKDAIKLKKDFAEAYFNLGLAFFDIGELSLSYTNFLKAYEIKKDYKKARDAIIEVLSYYTPKKNISIIDKINLKLKKVQLHLKDISNTKILTFYENCKEIVDKDLKDLSYEKNEIIIRKSKFLNCQRHKALFNKHNIISKFCFSCFKVVIETKDAIDLIKLTLIFQESDFLKFFLRKTMLDNRENKISFKGFVYCSSINEMIQIEKRLKEKLNFFLIEPISINSKRGCSEFGASYPEYPKINKDNSLNFNYKKNWQNIEKNFDTSHMINIKFEKKVNATLLETSLHNFLVINKWMQIK